MSFASDRLVDFRAARAVGTRVSGSGPRLSTLDRARLLEDFGDVVRRAERMVEDFTGLTVGPARTRPWVMSRGQWVDANLRGFERVLEPFARKVVGMRSDGPMAPARRAVLGAQLGGLLGYLGHRVLGQYDVFLPPDDDGLLYFVGPNIVTLERRHSLPEREFRLWLALHEVAHRVQFGGAPWLRGHLSVLMDSYLKTVEVDPRWLVDALRRAVQEVRQNRTAYRGLGWVFLLMTPDQREMVRRMQAVMSLLEGHGNFVMNALARDEVPSAPRFARLLHERRTRPGMEKMFQKAIGFDVKVRQYDVGERFVSGVVDRAGMDGFNRVWEEAGNLPTLDEIVEPQAWVDRVAS